MRKKWESLLTLSNISTAGTLTVFSLGSFSVSLRAEVFSGHTSKIQGLCRTVFT